MDCEAVRERLLEASATALAGHGESVVARHVRSCAGCHTLATRILAETERLAAELEGASPRMSAEEAVRVARAGGRAAVQGDRRPWRRWAPFPVAAAAAIAALLLTTEPRGLRLERAGPPPPSVAAGPGATLTAESPEGFRVDVPERGRVAVFETSNPSITVVWYY